MTAIHTEHYPPSYYFSSLKYKQEYPVLTDAIDADICIIGGGFTGIASAVELAERGYKVVVLEAHKIGWGASGRNGGQLIRGIGHELEDFRNTIGQEGIDAITAMGIEANDVVIKRINKYQIDCDLTMGYCDLASKAKHMKSLAQDCQRLNNSDYGFDVKMLDKSELKQQVIGSDNFIGGMIDMGSGHLHPLNLCTGEAKTAADLGVEIYTDSPVSEIIPGNIITVKTSQGLVKANKVILAGNAYMDNLAPKNLPNIANKVLPAGSYIIATEPLDANIHQQLLPGNHAVCDLKIDLDYFRLSADKRLLFGGMCNYSGRDPKDIKAALYPKMLKVFPHLEGINIDYQWGGMIGIGANRLPQIGRLTDNIFYAQAYSGHGVNVTHMAAKLLAEAIHGESDRIKYFEQVKHFAFPGGKYLRSPLLALGMMYHKMLDAF
ncbi:MAG: FAD-binding oxidoreductase [Colwellia sp.]|nr:FAD-binding oxidoreductase [Colwellia sp.]MCW8864804.1 FAD-binding oxidoreductase [Colwellia sp.]MCW9081035.1 FAD-binding oxidoreductase [Colwellia sp.]